MFHLTPARVQGQGDLTPLDGQTNIACMQWRRRLLALLRRPLVLLGLLLVLVGTPEVIIGHTKSESYRRELAQLPPGKVEADPARLYPTRTATDEKRAVAEAKVGYYDLLRSAGRVLVLLGLASMAIGAVRPPRRTRRPRAEAGISA
jgi:hypothetical protein